MKAFLFVCSLLYGLAVRVLIWRGRLRPFRLDCAVISVGNITLGGTGKTPLVMAIARYLKARGCEVAVLTRGYKRKTAGRRPPAADCEEMGDEPRMMQRALEGVPVIVDADRKRGALRAIREYKVKAVILDDGFQQWGLKKDLEIVAVCALQKLGNRRMIPRGILREPLSSLKRADLFVITKTNLEPDTRSLSECFKRINPGAPVFRSAHVPVGLCPFGKPEPMMDAGYLKGKKIAVFSGIADPGSFARTVAFLGADVALTFDFPDHHRYCAQDILKISEGSRQRGISVVVTTEKDAVKLAGLPGGAGSPQFFFLRMELRITTDEERFLSRLRGSCAL